MEIRMKTEKWYMSLYILF